MAKLQGNVAPRSTSSSTHSSPSQSNSSPTTVAIRVSDSTVPVRPTSTSSCTSRSVAISPSPARSSGGHPNVVPKTWQALISTAASANTTSYRSPPRALTSSPAYPDCGFVTRLQWLVSTTRSASNRHCPSDSSNAAPTMSSSSPGAPESSSSAPKKSSSSAPKKSSSSSSGSQFAQSGSDGQPLIRSSNPSEPRTERRRLTA